MAAMDDRNGGRASAERVLAIDSSSEAAAEWVSLSDSLWRQVSTRCFRSRAFACLAELEADILRNSRKMYGERQS